MTGERGAEPPIGIDTDMETLMDGITALRQLAAEKPEDNSRVYDFSIRWGVLLSGRLKRLEYYYRADELTEEQARRYRELRQELKEAMPQIERLGVGRPTVPLEDRERP